MVSAPARPSFSHLPAAPGPRGHWLIGHLGDLSRDSLATFSHVSRTHGDVARLQMLGLGRLGARYDLHVLSHPDDIAHILDRNAANYPNPGLLRSRYITLFGPCILSAEGADWERRRKLEAPAFSRARLNVMADRVVEETQVTIERWENRLDNDQATFDVVPDMLELTLRVAGRMLLGTDFSEALAALAHGHAIASRDMNLVWLHENVRVIKRIPTPRRHRFGQARAHIERSMIEIVQARRQKLAAGESENDLLDILLNARDAEGIGWTDVEVAGEMHAAARAGQDTTTASVVWAMLLLSRHPEVQARLQAELESELGGRLPAAADLSRLPYLRAVYDETLRLYPPIPTVARTAAQEDAIRGHRIPAGGNIVLLPWLTHRDPRWWPDASKFMPERFLKGADKADRPKYAYFPFGGGPRFCMGAGLALLQGPLILATLAQKYRMHVSDNHKVRPRAKITIMPDGGLPVTIERR